MKKISFLILSIILLSLYVGCDTDCGTTTTTISYTIVFQPNGGTGVMDNIKLKEWNEINLPACTFTVPTGMKFSCWNTDKNGKGKTFQNQEKIKNLTKTPFDIITLYAQWIDKDAHTITYNCDKPINNPNSTTFLESETIILKDVTTDGCIFEGWFDASTDERIYRWGVGERTENVTLVAKWTYGIYFDANGGIGTMAPCRITVDNLPKNTFTRLGFDFCGWTTVAGGSGDYYPKQAIVDLSSRTSPLTLYAHWGSAGLSYKNGDTTCEVSKGTFDGTDLIIPLYSTEGKKVVGITEMAFDGCKNLTSVVIGDNVQTIGLHAFTLLDSLTSVEIGDGVQTIGQFAFSNCNNLASIEMGDGVQTIGWGAFAECDSLTNIEIGDKVQTIGQAAFAYCGNLASIEMGNGVETIEALAFVDCDSLTNIEIGDRVQTIGQAVFSGCSNLASVTIYTQTPPTIEIKVFESCNNLSNIFVPARSVVSYKSAEGWKNYESKIKAIPE